MKVIILGNASSIHTTKLANEMALRKHDVHLISLHPIYETLESRMKLYKLPVPANIGYYINLPFLINIVRNIKPDIINAHYASGYGTLARLLNYDPTILSVWGSDIYEFPLQSKWKYRILIKNLKSATIIASTSHVMKKQVETLVNKEREIAITPFGVDCKKFTPIDDKGDDVFRIGTVKSLYPTYGISYLIEAFAIAMKKGMKNAELIIIGDGKQKCELEKLCRTLKIDDYVRFIGKIPHENIPKWLNTFHVFAALSVFESFGVSIIEASACGLPVVVSDAGGLQEVVIDGETGFIVPKCDPNAAAEKILHLYENSALRNNMGRNGRNFVLKNYEWKENVDRIEELYMNIVNR
jgi:glycosyltransferase involved in cell wall biosynthesis